jgi:general secretion pathway protein D
VGGFTQPTFGQRKIEHDIRLKEGEVNLLGGLIQTSETVTVTGLPGLSQIPFLRYLFSTEHRDRTDTEVLVMLTPRVIRLPELGAGGLEVEVTGGGASGGAPPPAFPGIAPQPVPEVPQQPEGPAEAPGQPQP